MFSTEPGYSDFVAMGIVPENKLQYDYSDKSLRIFGSQQFSPGLWKKNGKISSIADLNGAQIILVPNSASDYKLPDRFSKFTYKEQRELSKAVNIKTIVFSFANGHEIWVDGSHITKSKYQSGFPVFSIIFPESNEKISTLRILNGT